MARKTKKPETEAPERLSDEQRERIVRWVRKSYPQYERTLGRLWGACRDHHQARGHVFADWEAAFRTWIRRQESYDRRRSTAPRRATSEPQALRDVVREVVEAGEKGQIH